ncbi:MAG: BON domain-containing protein [Desulfobacterales bacterium]
MLISDKELKKNVSDRLREDRRLDVSKIHVDVKHGEVILEGSTETYQASAFAQEDVAGVAGVEKIVNRIEVQLPEKIAPPTDEAIRARIRAVLLLESDIVPVDFVLAVSEGVVFIDGFVESLKEKRRIGKIAARERGVLEVRNNLTVVPGQHKGDGEITERIHAALKSVEPSNIKNVSFRVERGVTTLTGTVIGLESRHRVNDAVASVLGVLDVRDYLDVAGGKDDSSS